VRPHLDKKLFAMVIDGLQNSPSRQIIEETKKTKLNTELWGLFISPKPAKHNYNSMCKQIGPGASRVSKLFGTQTTFSLAFIDIEAYSY